MRFREWVLSEMPIDFSVKSLGKEFYKANITAPVHTNTIAYLRKRGKKLLAYHATFVENFWPILEKGIRSGGGHGRFEASYPNRTYFALDPSSLKRYAYDSDHIIFVFELPGGVVRGKDDISEMGIMGRKHVPPDHIVGVIYPPPGGSEYPIGEFVRRVQRGDFPQIPPNESFSGILGTATHSDVENRAADYLSQVASHAKIDKYLRYQRGGMKAYIYPHLPPWEQMKNWMPGDVIKFLQGIVDQADAFSKTHNPGHRGWKIPPEAFGNLPAVPLGRLVSGEEG